MLSIVLFCCATWPFSTCMSQISSTFGRLCFGLGATSSTCTIHFACSTCRQRPAASAMWHITWRSMCGYAAPPHGLCAGETGLCAVRMPRQILLCMLLCCRAHSKLYHVVLQCSVKVLRLLQILLLEIEVPAILWPLCCCYLLFLNNPVCSWTP